MYNSFLKANNIIFPLTDIDSICSEFDNGSTLHIAASNLASEAVRFLLQNGANPLLKDDLGRTALGTTKHQSFTTDIYLKHEGSVV